MKRLLFPFVGLLLLSWLLQACLFVLAPGEAVVLLRQDRVDSLVVAPGLHWMPPPPLARLERLDLRRQLLRSAAPQTLRSADGQALQLEWALQWQLRDPALAVQKLGSGRASIERALQQRVDQQLQRQLAGTSLDAFVQGLRGALQPRLRDALAAELAGSGVAVLDWRVTRYDVDPALGQRIVAAMSADLDHARQAELAQVRAELAAVRVQAVAGHAARLRLADARVQAQQNQTLAEVVTATAPSYRRNPAFARDYRALLTERDALARQGTVVVLDADSPLLQQLRSAPASAAAR